MDFKDFKKAAEAKGFIAREPSPGHWQVIGKSLINYWPLSKRLTMYNATSKKTRTHVLPLDVIREAEKEAA